MKNASAPCPERFFDEPGGHGWVVGGTALAGRVHDWVAGEVVEQGQGPAVRAIDPEESDLRIDRSHGGDLVIRWEGIGAPHIGFGPVLQPQPAVLADPGFFAGSRAGPDRFEVSRRLFDRLDDKLRRVRPDNTVAMTRVDDHVRSRDAEVLLDLAANRSEEIIADPPDFSNRDRIHRYEDHFGAVTFQDERLGEAGIIDRSGRAIGDVHLGHAAPKFSGQEATSQGEGE